ncbi:hypothetical protein BC332_18814 [Capsicum chinense]|nr:hypothetical protein BC332_18814 [Capsicum chinense]
MVYMHLLFMVQLLLCSLTGLLNQSKGLYKAALEDYSNALAVYPSHVSSLVSSAVVLRKIGKQSPAIIRSLLTEALRLDRMNASAWCNLRLLYEEEGLGSALEEEEEEKKERGGED